MDLINLGFWLFSTLVQATAVLFAVVGVFVIFKIQLIREGAALFLETVKDAYIQLKKIEKNPLHKEYRKLSLYSLEEMITRIRELIAEKENQINHNRKEIEEAEEREENSFAIEENISRLMNEIVICKEKAQTLEGISQSMIDIKTKGKKSLRNICLVFFTSLIALFLVPFLAEWLIIILSLVLVGVTMLIVIDLTIIISKSLDIK